MEAKKNVALGRRIMAEDTLVKYGTPKLITCHQVTIPPLERLQGLIDRSGSMEEEGCPPPDRTKICKETGMSKKESEEILNYILPPNEWEENRKYWRQTVSSDPSSRRDVIELTDELNSRLQSANASDIGIDETRRKIYTQCFDEMIRQTTVRCAERGLMLYLCRQEIDFSLSAYKKLYISSGAYAIRKTLLSVKGSENNNSVAGDFVSKNDILKGEIREIKEKIFHEKKRFEEQRKVETKQRFDELDALERKRTVLKKELEGLVSGRKM